MPTTLQECQLECERKMSDVKLDIQKIKGDLASLQRVSEDHSNSINDIKKLSESVAILANNMASMLEEQKRQGARLNKLEEKPVKRWESVMDTVLKVILTAAIGVLLVKVGLQ